MWVSGDRSSYRGHDWRFARRLARLLPPITYVVDHVQACGRFASRYVSKSRAQRTRRRGVCRREEGRRADGEPLDENQILGDEKYPSLPLEVVAIVARQLHYVDLVNLSRSSKRLRTTFFGAMDPSATMERLREDVCVGKSGQYECGICSMQVCEGCVENTAAPQPEASNHLQFCRPRCSGCFYSRQCRFKFDREDYWEETQPYDYDYDDAGGALTTNYYPHIQTRGTGKPIPALDCICQACELMPGDEIQRAAEERALEEAERLARDSQSCAVCDKLLPPGGPRWWVNEAEARECRWDGHLARVSGSTAR